MDFIGHARAGNSFKLSKFNMQPSTRHSRLNKRDQVARSLILLPKSSLKQTTDHPFNYRNEIKQTFDFLFFIFFIFFIFCFFLFKRQNLLQKKKRFQCVSEKSVFVRWLILLFTQVIIYCSSFLIGHKEIGRSNGNDRRKTRRFFIFMKRKKLEYLM